MSDTKSSPFAVDIVTAAQLVGLSRAQFYRLYLNPGLVTSMKTGGRDRIIDYGELQSAYSQLRAGLPRADLSDTQSRLNSLVGDRTSQTQLKVLKTTNATPQAASRKVRNEPDHSKAPLQHGAKTPMTNGSKAKPATGAR